MGDIIVGIAHGTLYFFIIWWLYTETKRTDRLEIKVRKLYNRLGRNEYLDAMENKGGKE